MSDTEQRFEFGMKLVGKQVRFCFDTQEEALRYFNYWGQVKEEQDQKEVQDKDGKERQ